MKTEQIIGNRRCYIYSEDSADIYFIQPIDEHDLEVLDREVEIIKELSGGSRFVLAAFLVDDWNKELSPWEVPAVFGKENFGGGAEETLSYILNTLISTLNEMYGSMEKRYYIGGYSLAGLFSLWSAYRTDIFQGVAAASPSVWFQNWNNYIEAHTIQTPKIYLSLGDKEEKARNRIMSTVGDNIRLQHKILSESANVKECILEWNKGNHFMNSEVRTAKGFSWLINSCGG